MCPPHSHQTLSQLFLANAADPAAVRQHVEHSTLEDDLLAFLARARAEQPSLTGVADETLLRHVARNAATETVSFQDLVAGDILVAAGCLAGDDEASAAFERELRRTVQTAVRHLAREASFIDEVTQALRFRLLVADDRPRARLADYTGKGPLGGWIRVGAVRLALTLRQAIDREGRTHTTDEYEVPHDQSDPELAYLRTRYAADLQQALTRAVAHLDEKERTLLRMHHARDMTVDEIGALFGVHRATAARWIVRARESLLAAVKDELAVALSLDPSEAASLAKLADSQLDLTLGGLLQLTAAPASHT